MPRSLEEIPQSLARPIVDVRQVRYLSASREFRGSANRQLLSMCFGPNIWTAMLPGNWESEYNPTNHTFSCRGIPKYLTSVAYTTAKNSPSPANRGDGLSVNQLNIFNSLFQPLGGGLKWNIRRTCFLGHESISTINVLEEQRRSINGTTTAPQHGPP